MNETEKRAEILLKSIGREMHRERVENSTNLMQL